MHGKFQMNLIFPATPRNIDTNFYIISTTKTHSALLLCTIYFQDVFLRWRETERGIHTTMTWHGGQATVCGEEASLKLALPLMSMPPFGTYHQWRSIPRKKFDYFLLFWALLLVFKSCGHMNELLRLLVLLLQLCAKSQDSLTSEKSRNEQK